MVERLYNQHVGDIVKASLPRAADLVHWTMLWQDVSPATRRMASIIATHTQGARQIHQPE
jgi:hypothetical protein